MGRRSKQLQKGVYLSVKQQLDFKASFSRKIPLRLAACRCGLTSTGWLGGGGVPDPLNTCAI